MKGLKKLSLLLVMLLLLVPTLVACGSGGNNRTSDGKLIIGFAGRGKDAEKNNYTRFINEFMDSYSDIYVDIQWRANEAAHNSYLANSSAKNLPTMFMLDNRQFIPYVDSGKLYDMTDKVPEEELDLIFESSHDPYWWNSTTKLRGRTSGAGLYGLPKDQGPWVMVYNKELFTQCANLVSYEGGFPSATQPMTFDSFKQLLATLVNETTRASLGETLMGIAGYDLETAVNSNNAGFFTGDDAVTSAITSPNFVQAVQFMADLQTSGLMPTMVTASTGAYSNFTAGKSVFYFVGPWDIANFWAGDVAFEFDICPVLTGMAEGAVSTSRVGSMGYVISDAATQEEKEAAVKLARYLAVNESSQRTQYKVGQAIPNLKSMANVEYIDDTLNLLGSNKTKPASRSVFIDAVDGIKDANDKVTGKFEACAYTYSNDWLDAFNEYLRRENVWKGADIAGKLAAYNPTLQAELDNMQYSLRG